MWDAVFKSFGQRYGYPTLVLFTGSTRTGCDQQTSVSGPFYCEIDEKIYLDLLFSRRSAKALQGAR